MRYVPLLVFPFLLYNAFAFFIFTNADVDFRNATMGSVGMPSGVIFTLTVGTTLVILALVLFAIELFRMARIGAGSFADHVLKVALLAAYLAEFFLVAQAATGTFLTLATISLVDLASGLAVVPNGPPDSDFEA